MIWKPIETAPMNGSLIMTYRDSKPYFEPMYCSLDGEWCWYDGDAPSVQPTHWCDLKKPGEEQDVTEGVALTEEQARILDAVNAAPIAKSLEVDFENAKMTWTFCINQECRVGAGRYALVRID